MADDLEPTGRFSTAAPRRRWYAACRSAELRGRPLARRLLGWPIVVFRAGSEPGALLDRCPHRNVPLSLGRVAEERLECGYHGWQFDRTGACRRIPSLDGEPAGRGRTVAALAALERDGFVWVFAAPGEEPRGEPFRLPHLGEPGYTSQSFSFLVAAPLLAAAENVLDVPHTAFLHRGLFRGGAPKRITAVVRRWADRAEAEYVGEPVPEGLAARLLAPRGGDRVEHFDRFFLPSIAQVEYRLGADSHLVVTSALTPEDDFATRLHAIVTLRLPFPAALVRPLLSPIARWIFRQDARILARQTDNVRRFGGERFTTTDADVLGPHVAKLLRDAAEAEAAPPPAPDAAPVWERRIEILA